MPDQIKCPICRTVFPASLDRCPECGAELATLEVNSAGEMAALKPARLQGSGYESALGEDDLYAPRLLRLPWWSLVFPILIGGVVLAVLGALLANIIPDRISGSAPDAAAPIASLPAGLPGATRAPTLFLPTLTPTDTPTTTPSPTSTPGPCEQVVGQGDNLIMLATRCGHRDLAVIDQILQLNGLRSAESLQLGQTILIPWPTPTPGPELLDDAADDTSGGESTIALTGLSDGESAAPPTEISDVIPTATLQPGVMWYTVQPDDNIIKIAVLFSANVEILSQLNPEVTFSQCDHGMDFGGANCIVQLYQGQRIRVPAPTPTPTLSPTPSGSETPTPTPTATFNAPSLLSPGDRFLFGADDIVTLRWASTGMLTEGDVYRVTVTDTVLSQTYTAITREALFILPDEWQPSDGERHLFTWEVAVGPADGAGGLSAVTFSTSSRMFFWDSR